MHHISGLIVSTLESLRKLKILRANIYPNAKIGSFWNAYSCWLIQSVLNNYQIAHKFMRIPSQI